MVEVIWQRSEDAEGSRGRGSTGAVILFGVEVSRIVGPEPPTAHDVGCIVQYRNFRAVNTLLQFLYRAMLEDELEDELTAQKLSSTSGRCPSVHTVHINSIKMAVNHHFLGRFMLLWVQVPQEVTKGLELF